ncbi:MAG: ACT domain-containing protein [Colwellia sp.]
MKAVTLVNICGKSQPDRLKYLTEKSLQLGANWLNSKVSYLEGYVSALIKIEVDYNRLEDLKALFTQYNDITVNFSDVSFESITKQAAIKLVVDAEDRPGIVNEITQLFSDLGVEILNLNSQSLCAAGLGNTMFTADITLSLPSTLKQSDLTRELASLSDDIVVTVVE